MYFMYCGHFYSAMQLCMYNNIIYHGVQELHAVLIVVAEKGCEYDVSLSLCTNNTWVWGTSCTVATFTQPIVYVQYTYSNVITVHWPVRMNRVEQALSL